MPLIHVSVLPACGRRTPVGDVRPVHHSAVSFSDFDFSLSALRQLTLQGTPVFNSSQDLGTFSQAQAIVTREYVLVLNPEEETVIGFIEELQRRLAPRPLHPRMATLMGTSASAPDLGHVSVDRIANACVLGHLSKEDGLLNQCVGPPQR